MENLLERNIEKSYGMNGGATVGGAIMGIVIGIVLIVGAAIPITQSIIAASTITGVNATILQITITLLCLTPAMMVASMF